MRRIVTALTPEGRSVLVSDGLPPNIIRPTSLPGLELVDLWSTSAAPSLSAQEGDPTGRMATLPDTGGTYFRLVRIDPGRGMGMHFTNTIDYLAVLAGEVVLEVEDGPEVVLEPGDCVVQLGARHAWHNRSAEPCIMAAVIIGAS